VLFGIYGNEDTNEGKTRLGWLREIGADDKKSGPFVPEKLHLERMTGLGAGFAAITLRDYSKSKLQNPYPVTHFWRALAAILNVPPEEVTNTHFAVLKNMIEHYVLKILNFFGRAGLLVLRRALLEWPQEVEKVGKGGTQAKSLEVLAQILRKDKKLYL
jgi:nucleoporin GLE1